MRWGRFRGLEFAPVFAVNAGAGGRSRALQTPCRVRSRLAICPWMRKVRIGARLQGGFGVAAYAAVRALEAILFRSCFDSAEARQTVRWRCFWSLEFALENGAATESNAAGFATVGRCGVGASTMVFWGWRGSAGIRSAPVRGCGMRNKRSLGRRSRFGVNHSGRCPFFAGRKAGLCFAVCFDFQSLACGRPGFENRCASIVFRYRFDSTKARQTVRWGRF